MKTKIIFLFLTVLAANHLAAQTWSGATPGNIYYSAGNVGIGTSTPGSKLHVDTYDAGDAITVGALHWTGAKYAMGIHANASFTIKELSVGVDRLIISPTGNVGIGTVTPSSKLHIDTYDAADALTFTAIHWTGAKYAMGIHTNASFTIRDPDTGTDRMLITPGGNVLIAKTSQLNAAYRLDVDGSVRANEVVVNTTGADFVFDKDYELRPLEEVEKFVEQNKHLPEIESAKEMEENGLALGKMDMKLLQKIEELTLYLIELKKEMNEMKDENQQLKKRVGELERN